MPCLPERYWILSYVSGAFSGLERSPHAKGRQPGYPATLHFAVVVG